jgi:hypothetical protein
MLIVDVVEGEGEGEGEGESGDEDENCATRRVYISCAALHQY